MRDRQLGATMMALLLGACSGGTSVSREPVDTPLTGLPQFVFSSAIADVDGDGRADLLLFARNSHTAGLESVVALISQDDGSFRAKPSAAGIFREIVADLNRDGRADLVSGCANPGRSVLARLGMGDGTFAGQATIPALQSDCGEVAVGDFNGDGFADILRFGRDTDATLLLGSSTGSFTPSVVAVPQHGGTQQVQAAIAVALDAGGRDDLVVLNGDASRAANWIDAYVSEGTSFRRSSVSEPAGSVVRFFVADTEGDGRRDLVTLNEFHPAPPDFALVTDPKPTLHRFGGNASGGFGAETWSRVSRELRAVAVGDMDGDGLADIVVLERVPGSIEEEVRILRGNRTGGFDEPAEPRFRGISLGDSPIGMHVAVVDSDGRPDVILVYANGVRVLRGE